MSEINLVTVKYFNKLPLILVAECSAEKLEDLCSYDLNLTVESQSQDIPSVEPTNKVHLSRDFQQCGILA